MRYDFGSNKFEKVYENYIALGYNYFNFQVLKLKDSKLLGFDVFCIHVPDLLYRNYVYSSDDTERFLAFQIATLDWILTLNKKPDVLHVHDHHTGLIPFMVTQSYKYKALKDIPTVLTIHNAQYQGWFSHEKVSLIPPFNFDNVGLLDWKSTINSLASAIKCSWRVTTVSPSYMEELKQNANGLESLLSYESNKCVGILNGIDWDVWNPKTDERLVKNYTSTSVVAGKKANKKWLCNEFNLDENKPLFTFIGRLVGEKGSDLFPEIFSKALRENNISILLLGSGDKGTEQRLGYISKENFNSYIGYNEKLAHIMYAGADFLLICTNTMHEVAPEIEKNISIPILHIADATAEVIKKNKLKTVGLLGTAFTMERTFYKDRLIEKHGINVLIPNDEDRKIVHDVIYNELCLGKIEASSKQEYIRIINELSASGAQAVILGCTEIGMLVKQADTDVLLLDTTAIHAQKAVEQAMQD